jgi:hypothetical protein
MTLAKTIVETLASRGGRGISFVKIADAAFRSGQPHLAAMLLSNERVIANQVPLLLSMGRDGEALEKAVESGDWDLVYLAIFHLKKKLPLADFFRVVGARKKAVSALAVYSKGFDIGVLKDFYYQDDQRGKGADLLVEEASVGVFCDV